MHEARGHEAEAEAEALASHEAEAQAFKRHEAEAHNFLGFAKPK